MTNKEVKKLKDRYNHLLGCKKELLEILKRINELKETDEVREYLKLCEMINDGKGYSFYGIEKLSNNEILDKVADGFIPIEDNHIYTYIGRDDATNLMRFKNIETAIIHNISENNVEAFEKENIVMYPLDYDYDDFYKSMRRSYYEKIVNNYSDKFAKEQAYRYSYMFSRKD